MNEMPNQKRKQGKCVSFYSFVYKFVKFLTETQSKSDTILKTNEIFTKKSYMFRRYISHNELDVKN